MAQAPPLTPSRDHDKQQRQEGPLERSASTSAHKAQHGLGQMRRAPIRPPLITDAVGRHRRVKAVCPGRQRPSRDAAESLSTGSRRRLAAARVTGYAGPAASLPLPPARSQSADRLPGPAPDQASSDPARPNESPAGTTRHEEPGLRPDPAAPRRSRTSATGGTSPPHPRCGSSSNASVRRAECWQGLATRRPGGHSHLSAWALRGLLIHCGRCPLHLEGARLRGLDLNEVSKPTAASRSLTLCTPGSGGSLVDE